MIRSEVRLNLSLNVKLCYLALRHKENTMKTLFLGITLLSLNIFAADGTCFLYDAGHNQSYKLGCSSINIEEAQDEGYSVFSEVSTDLLDGCLISEYRDQQLSREHRSNVCEQGVDEGWFVLGRM